MTRARCRHCPVAPGTQCVGASGLFPSFCGWAATGDRSKLAAIVWESEHPGPAPRPTAVAPPTKDEAPFAWPATSLMSLDLSREERKLWRARIWGCPARHQCHCARTLCHNDVMARRFGRLEDRDGRTAYLVSEVDCMACIATFDRGLMPPRDRDTTG